MSVFSIIVDCLQMVARVSDVFSIIVDWLARVSECVLYHSRLPPDGG